MAEISTNKTIARNTLLLYFRMMFTMIVALYTSRVNLNVLGIEDNGIYQIVGGLIAMFSFLNGSLSGATSRFLTYELGRGDKQKLKETFAVAFNIHLFVAFIIFLLSETIGIWFLENKLVIPEARMNAARIVYQVSILTTMLSIIQVPFNASIISHERMAVFAYMSIWDVTLKLLICYLLYITPFDRLITYGVLILCVTAITQWIYKYYCFKHFEECCLRMAKDRTIIKQMLSFSGWDLFGNFSVMARSQGVNIILNMFFGPAINAACGFAATVGYSIFGFANNFMTAIRPPIVKAYSVGDYVKMEGLMINASKYSFCLLLLLSAPFIFESSFILNVWLKNPPFYTDIFSVLELMLSLCSSLFLPLVFAIHASGRIKFMSIVNGTIWFMVVPVTYIMLRMGASPIIPYYTKIGLLLFVVLSNLYSVKHIIPVFNILQYLREAVLPSVLMAIIALSLSFIAHKGLYINDIVRFLVTCTVSTISIMGCTYLIILSKEEKLLIKQKVRMLLCRK